MDALSEAIQAGVDIYNELVAQRIAQVAAAQAAVPATPNRQPAGAGKNAAKNRKKRLKKREKENQLILSPGSNEKSKSVWQKLQSDDIEVSQSRVQHIYAKHGSKQKASDPKWKKKPPSYFHDRRHLVSAVKRTLAKPNWQQDGRLQLPHYSAICLD